MEHGSVPARARGKSGRFRVVSERVGHAARDGMRRKAKRALRKFDRGKEGWGKYARATSAVLSVWVTGFEIAVHCGWESLPVDAAAAVCFAEQLRGARPPTGAHPIERRSNFVWSGYTHQSGSQFAVSILSSGACCQCVVAPGWQCAQDNRLALMH